MSAGAGENATNEAPSTTRNDVEYNFASDGLGRSVSTIVVVFTAT